MASSSGTRFPLYANDYQFLEEIGDGGYRAQCILPDEIVAIEIWNLRKCTNDLETIRKQVHKLSLLDHPNLLRPHSSFLDGSSLWIVMPYMSRGSCFNIMKSVYPQGLEEPVIAIFLREILKALVYLHGLGRTSHTHRNVKAGNILVDSEGTVKLGDFEVSACMLDSVERMHTSSGNTFVGTSCCMAPEEDMQQVDGYGFKVDTWSFGMTALEFSHGHSPFSKYSPMAVLPLTSQNSPRPDYEEDMKFSKSFRELVAASLIEDPEKSPTAAKLLEYSFFQHAHSTEYLASTILDGISPLGERYRKLKEEEAKLVKGIDGNKEKLAQDKQKNDEQLLTSGQLASPVNPVSCDAAQILPLLQTLLIHNDIQRERLIGLIQLYDTTAEIRFPLSIQKAGRLGLLLIFANDICIERTLCEARNLEPKVLKSHISTTETDVLSEVHVLQQSVKKLEKEVEKQKTENIQLSRRTDQPLDEEQ